MCVCEKEIWCTKEVRARARAYVVFMCVSANAGGWKDFRMGVPFNGSFRDGKISRLSLSLSHIALSSVRFGTSVRRIARRHSHSCVTIRGQLRLLVASGSWKKTKTPGRAKTRTIVLSLSLSFVRI